MKINKMLNFFSTYFKLYFIKIFGEIISLTNVSGKKKRFFKFNKPGQKCIYSFFLKILRRHIDRELATDIIFLNIWLIAENTIIFFWYAPCYILIVESAHESAVRRELWVFSPSGTSDSARVRIFRFDLNFLDNNYLILSAFY